MALAGERVKAGDLPTELSGGYAEVTSGQAGISADTDLTNLTVTVNVLSGRTIKIHGHIHSLPSATAVRWILWLKEGATALAAGRGTCGAAVNTVSQEVFRRIAPSAGSHTYKLSLQAIGGTADMICDGGLSYGPSFIEVVYVT